MSRVIRALGVLGWTALACVALGIAAFVGVMAWVTVAFPPVEGEPVPWGLVAVEVAVVVVGVLGWGLCGKAAVARFGRR